MVDNVFARSPIDNAIAAITLKPRGLPQAVKAPDPTAAQAPPSVPTNLVPAFEAAAEKHGVPVAALMAAAEARSGFQTHRVTPDGRGIMRLPGGGGANPYIPEQAIEAFAADVAAQVKAGKRLQDVIAPELLARAKQIEDQLYPFQPDTEGPAARNGPRGQRAEDKGGRPGMGGFLTDVGEGAAEQVLTGHGAAIRGIGSVVRGAGSLLQLATEPLMEPEAKAAGAADINVLDPVADAIQAGGEAMQSLVSADAKKAIADSNPDGDITKPSTWTMGKNPSVRGYTLLAAAVLGSMAPVVAAAVASGGVGGAVVGGLQGGGAGAEAARDAINKLHEEGRIEQESAYFRELVSMGMPPEQALRKTRAAAEKMAFLFSAPVAAVGGVATSIILNPAAKIAGRANLPGRIAARAGLGAVEEGAQEAAESIGAKVGTNLGAGTDMPVTAGTFADFVLGALGGGVTGAGAGALSNREGAPAASSRVEPTMDPPADPADAGIPPEGPPPPPPMDVEASPEPQPQAPTPAGPLERAAQMAPEMPAETRVVITPEGLDPITAVVERETPEGFLVRADDGNRYQIGRDEIDAGTVSIEPEVTEDPEAVKPLPKAAPPTVTVHFEGAPTFSGTIIHETPDEVVVRDVNSGNEHSIPRADIEMRAGVLFVPTTEVPQVTSEPEPAKAAEKSAEAAPVDAEPALTGRTFKTAKGSTYAVHTDGSTSRNKAPRPEHPGKRERGPQPRSEQTFYVTREDAEKLAEIQAQSGSTRAIEVAADQAAIRYLDGKDKGRFEARTLVSIQREPAVGLTPVELWKGGTRVHFGNEIVEVTDGEGGAAQSKPAPAAPAKAAEKAAEPKPLDQMDEAELRARLKYVAEQGKRNGWNKRLIAERLKVEEAIDALNKGPADVLEPAADSARSDDVDAGGTEAPVPGGSDQPAAVPGDDEGGQLAGGEGAAASVPGGGEGVPDAEGAVDAEPALTEGDGVEHHGDYYTVRGDTDARGLPFRRQYRDHYEDQAATARRRIAALEKRLATTRETGKDPRGGKNADAGYAIPKLTGDLRSARDDLAMAEKMAAKALQNPKTAKRKNMLDAVIESGKGDAAVEKVVTAMGGAAPEPKIEPEPKKRLTPDEGIAENLANIEKHGLTKGSFVSWMEEGKFELSPGKWSDVRLQHGTIKRLNKETGLVDIELHSPEGPTGRIIGRAARGLEPSDRNEVEGKDENGVPFPEPTPEEVAAADAVTAAANEAATSPTNDLPEPTQAQKEAGNYKLGHVRLGGLDISIENPAGSERKGVDRDGKAWSVTLASHYGYIRRTEGKDGDHVDVFVKPGVETLADHDLVFVVNQIDPVARKFDEHKVMLGFSNEAEAEAAYLANYAKGWKGIGSIAEKTLGEFKEWLADGDTTKPLSPTRVGSPSDSGIFHAGAADHRAKKGRVLPSYIKPGSKAAKDWFRGWDASEEKTAARAAAKDAAASVDQPASPPETEPAEEGNDGRVRTLDRAGEGSLEGAPPAEVRGAEGSGDAGERAEVRGGADASGDDVVRGSRAPRARGVGEGEAGVPVPARGDAEGERTDEGAADEPERRPAADRPDDEPGRVQEGADGRVEPASGLTADERPADFAITDEDAIGEGGAKTKFRNNFAAIRQLRELESRGRPALRSEQKRLAKYVGWGGLPQAFERSDGSFSKGWEKEGAQLKELLTAEEYAAAAASTRNAHYTSPEIVTGMWDAMQRLGFDGGKLLEPSVGVGNFFGLMPEGLRSATALHGVELDPITGGIAKHLYPAAKIAAPMGFQDYTIPDNYFDAVIGNPPFGSERLYDRNRKDLSKFSIHNYFFAKAIDALKPGGVLAMVVTNRMMDAARDEARSYIAERAELLGAIRLPNNAFAKNAGTEVTTDIIFLRKRVEGEARGEGEYWGEVIDYTDKAGNTVPLNVYFHNHPEMMLGEFGAFGSMYRPDDPALVAREGQNTAQELARAIARLPAGVAAPSSRAPTTEPVKRAGRVADVRVGSMFLDGGTVMVREPDSLGERQASPVEGLSETARARIVGMIDVRDALADLRALQLSETASADRIETARKRLNKVYDAFVGAHGYISADVNKRLFRDDPTFPQILSLEVNYDKGISAAVAKTTGEPQRKPSAEKAAIFSKRTQRPYKAPQSAATAKDALLAALSEVGRVDLEMMGRLYGQSEATIISELGDLIFDEPGRGWVTREEYLSGNVKAKLAQARDAAMNDAAYQRNVEALEAVQPEDIAAVDISVKAGAHWLPEKVVADFASHIAGGTKSSAFYGKALAKWIVDVNPTQEAQTRWATGRASVSMIVDAAVNQRTITIRDKVDDNKTVVNEKETQAANDKVAEVAEEWKRWIWSDDARRESLSRLYNDMFNTDVQRAYDGSHLTFPGKVDDSIVELNPHQVNAVWRGLQSGTMLLDHVVGAGKTFTMIAYVMEARRMGRARKPMLVVPNHLIEQWAGDFLRLYPGASVLAATKRDFEKDRRKALFARIATGDWDAVIVPHSSFGKVEVDPDAQIAFIDRQVVDLVASRNALREADGKDSMNVKRVEALIAKQKEKQKRLLDAGRKDDSLYYGELGIDALLVDEAHEFKNLEYSSSMTRITGLGAPEGSQKATDLYLKTQETLRMTGGRNVVFATGTPISNSMVEMFTMMRYLDYKGLDERGMTHFDAWARMFGEVVTDWELAPSGKYKLTSRFAKFVNLPELMQRYLSFADVVNGDDINALLAKKGRRLPVPRVKGGKPANVVVERSPAQAEYVGVPIKDADGNDTDRYPEGTLVWRSENLPKGMPKKGDDNMLKIMSDARKAALDMRMIDSTYGDYAGSKINDAADRMVDIYRRWDADKGAQLVFIDLSTPKSAKGAEGDRIRALIKAAEEGDEDAQAELDKVSPDELLALESDFSVYDDLKQKLIDRGVPADEIAFIHDAKTDQKKADLFGKVRSGRVRFLFGSTPKMGAGTNVQNRLVALHHLDAPWRPSDLEQREGRIIRQGNELYARDPDGFEVEIYRYATKGTLDARMWQTIEAKANFIGQVRKGAAGAREIEDIGGEAANAAEMKAAASGNPLVLEEMSLRQRIKRLEGERYAHEGAQHRVRDAIRWNETQIKRSESLIAAMRADKKRPQPKEFEATIRGETLDKRKDVGFAILKAAMELEQTKGEATKLGKYGGFSIVLDRLSKDRFRLTLVGDGEYATETFGTGADPQGLAQRIVNAVKDFDDAIARMERTAADAKAAIPKLREQIAEWPKESELSDVKASHRGVVEQLRPNKKAAAEPGEGAMENRADAAVEGGFASVQALDDFLRSSSLGGFIGKLIDAGTIDFQSVGATPGVRGWAENGRITLVASELTRDTAMSVLLHEAFHAGVEPLIGTKRWRNLLDRMGAILASQEAKAPGERSLWWRDAIAHLDAVGVPAESRAEELAAYAIDYREAAPVGIRAAIDNIVGSVKAWLQKTFGVQLGSPTPSELAALAKAALRDGWQPTDGGPDGGRRDSIRSIKRKIAKLVEAARGASTNTVLPLARASRSLIDRAAKAGLDLTDYDHVIDESAIRHILNRHSDPKVERDRNQHPVTPEAFQHIPDVIASPMRVVFGTKTNTGLEQVAYLGRLPDGKMLYLEEVRTGRRHLATKTLRLYSATARADDIIASLGLDARSDSIDPNVSPEGRKFNRAAPPGSNPPDPDLTFRERLSSTLTQALPALLATVPLRPMLTELAKDMPSARAFLKTKERMDALRNEWHAKVDALAKDWLAYRIAHRAENPKLMDIMHESTLAQVDPTKPYESKMRPADWIIWRNNDPSHPQWQAINAAVQEDKRRRAKHHELRNRLNALSPKAREVYIKVRDTYSEMSDDFETAILANLGKALDIGLRRAQRKFDAEMQRIADEGLEGADRDNAVEAAARRLKQAQTTIAWNRRARMTLLREQFETNRLGGPYFPLARFGRYFVTVRDADGKVISFSRFEKVSQQVRFYKEMVREHGEAAVEEGVLSEKDKARKQVDPTFVADIEEILEGAMASDAVKDAVWQRYLESLPDFSIRKNRIHRLGRAGFQTDALRAFSHNVFHGAHQLARLKYGMELGDHLEEARLEARQAPDPKRAGHVVDEMEARNQFILNPQGGSLAQAVTSATFVYQLSMSPAAALVNVSQTVIMGVPILAAYEGSAAKGITRASNELMKATRDFTVGGGKTAKSRYLTADERAAMEAAYSIGLIDKTQAHDLAGVAESGVEYSAWRANLMAVLSWMFHKAEVFNREVTFLAAYRMARKKGLDHFRAIDDASQLTWDTHFDYQNTSRPRVMQGDTAKVLLAFRNYNVNMLFRLFRDAHQATVGNPQARKEALIRLGGITGMMALTAGIKGTWMFGIAMTLAGLFFGGGDDPEEELKKGLSEFLPSWAVSIVLYGAPGYLLGTSLSERIGLPDLWFRSPDRQLEGEDAYNYVVDAALGASVAPIKNAFRGYDMIKDGNVYRGIETIAPKSIRDVMRSYRYATEGVLNLKGDDVIPLDEVSWADVAKQFLGFTPAQVAEQYDTNRADKNRESFILDARQRVLNDYHRARQDKDVKALEAVEEAMDAFNEEFPSYAITGKSLKRSRRARDRATAETEDGIRLNPKLRGVIEAERAPMVFR